MKILGDRGFVYVATGDKYVAEAAQSAASLRVHHRDPVVLFTDRPCGNSVFDHVVVIPNLPKAAEAKLVIRDTPFDRFIYLDSDTLVLGSFEEIFQLLEAFDVCVPAALGGYHYTIPEVSHAFREPSTSMIGFRRSAPVIDFFERWRVRFDQYRDVMGREWDQRSFRHAAYEDRQLRVCFLGDEWCLSPYPGGMLCRDARLVHGRPPEGLESMARRANERLGYRVLWQRMPVVHEQSQNGARKYLELALYFFLRAGSSAAKTLVGKVGFRKSG